MIIQGLAIAFLFFWVFGSIICFECGKGVASVTTAFYQTVIWFVMGGAAWAAVYFAIGNPLPF